MSTPVPAWPLRRTRGRRYLEDSAGTPFRLNADSAWFAPTEFWLADRDSAAEFERYLADRAAKGFSAILIMGMVQVGYDDYQSTEAGSYSHLPDNRISGVAPLRTPDDFGTPHPEYWDNVVRIVAAARRHDLAVLLAYNYLGYLGGDQGWWKQLQEPQNGREVMHDFGAWLADLLSPHLNVVWYPYGDFNPPPGEGSARVRATIDGIRSVQPDALFAAELDSPDDVIADNADADELLDMNSFYGYGPDADGRTYVTADEAWRSTPVRPAWVCEPQYESAGIGGSGSHDDVREAEYWSVLGGGTAGQVYGAANLYNFARHPSAASGLVDWRLALDFPGAREIALQFALWASLDWWKLVPSGTADGYYGVEIVASGAGEGLAHIAAAGTPDGAIVMVYVPRAGAREFEVDVSRMRGVVTAEWFDPTSGERRRVEVDASGSATATTVHMTAPSANAGGATDWVLILSGR